MKKIFVSIFILVSLFSYSQREGNMWYFGIYGALDFNSGSPVPVPNSGMTTSEGSASIADANGDLLFYTNGIDVWDRNNDVMPNGDSLSGHPSSSQSAVIVRKPGSTNQYYIFSVAGFVQTEGIRYSIIDMNLNGGLGDVNMIKNVLISSPNTEQIALVRHQNNTDFWLIIHKINTAEFESYLISSSGVSTIPIISSVGMYVNANNYIGSFKANSLGNKIAVSHSNPPYNCELFDFDNATGLLSNGFTLGNFTGININGPYGIEFSPDNSLLYVSSDFYPSKLYQFNLNASSNTNIINSRILLGTAEYLGALQLGPDGKIYCPTGNNDTLAVINSPNNIGAASNFDANGFYMGPLFMYGNLGLPTFYNSIYTDQMNVSNFCLSDTTIFSIESTLAIDSIQWNFDDVSSGANNTSNTLSPNHFYSSGGIYNVTSFIYHGLYIDTILKMIEIINYPIVSLPNDTSICGGDSILLNAFNIGAQYLWQNNTINSSIYAKDEDLYHVEVSFNNCTSKDSFNLSIIENIEFQLGDDTTLCKSDTLVLKVKKYESLLWGDGSTDSVLSIYESGNYTLKVEGVCNTVNSDVNVFFEVCDIELDCDFKLPNAFTPNNDLLNDYFFPLFGKDIKVLSFRIYNRWGVIVHNEITPWNGRKNEILQESDSYTYYIKYSCDKKIYSISGQFVLIE